ncbi:Protein of unknown function [Tistlia consotensis]|uniref:DUF2817 domain-containing protein n=1 Tax=Tistlia consotensis USBA 355 TaxID=560819 RepID=A0A1Y6B9N9_9PROT|nr:M14 family metallopeptidase [Tistlia consotensis]SME88956.1 Protein of unknown function [Tistlia consotensis USBA 355]SNR25519.1 Protein of unknown function [Tistlia consotensis]
MDLLTAAGTYFAKDYAEARRKFMTACDKAGVKPKSYVNPHAGPNGEELATDVAWFGPEDAKKVLVMVSSTHGVEGFPGSAGQCDWIENGRSRLPAGVGVLIVHAVNPYGFAWLRRCTEEGVDLNRNWVDFSRPLPENPGYEELHDALVPRSLDEATIEAADRKVKAYREQHGETQLNLARSGGQYSRPGGVFFGGREPTWARRTLERIIADYRLAERDLVAVVDYHTGLGPFGYGEPIADHTPGSVNVKRALAWYGESVTQPRLGTSSSVPKTGLAEYGWERLLGEKVTFVALEYGTYQPPRGMQVLRQDHWLHNETNVDWNDPTTKRIKAEIRAHFAPQMLDWQEMVLFRSRQIQRQALEGLAAA